MVIFRLITAPARGLGFVFRSVHDAVENELDEEREQIRQRLMELYSLVESGEIDEEEFEAQEDQLLDRLDELEDAM